MITDHYQQLASRVDSLQLRERLLVLIVGVVFICFLVDALGFQPIFKQQEALLSEINDREIELEVLRARSINIFSESSMEQLAPLEMLEQEVTSFSEKIKYRLDSMLSPDRAIKILKLVLDQNSALTLNSVNTQLSPLIAIDDETREPVTMDGVNQYQIDLQMEGGYLQILKYLRSLEALPWTFFWKGINFSTTEFPMASVDLEIHTLGQPRD